MEISVIIPTYGKPVFLKTAISSVISQTFSDWELIVVDDNNPDSEARAETEDIMKAFHDDRIRYLRHPRNLNGAAARNTGIRQAAGKYIAFLDSDDEYLKERLQKCHDVMEKSPGRVAFVYTGCEYRRSGKKYDTYTSVRSGRFHLQALACTFRLCTGSNLFVRKSVIDELHGFDERFLRHQDSEFIARVFEKYEIAAIPEVLVIKNNENFNVPEVEKVIEVKRLFLDKFREQIGAYGQKEQQYVYHSHAVQTAEQAIRSGKKQIADEYYAAAERNGRLTLMEGLRRFAFTAQYMKRQRQK